MSRLMVVRKHGHVAVAMDEEVLGMMDPTVLGLMTDPRVFDADGARTRMHMQAQHTTLKGTEATPHVPTRSAYTC